MLRILAITSVLAVLALIVAGTASAGWAGSIYKPSECTYNGETDQLYCEKSNYTLTVRRTETVYVEDQTCLSGYRTFERTGFYNFTYSIIWDVYSGRFPRAENNLFGSEGMPVEFWSHYHDVDTGCA
jgi:hypothetical protein